MEDNGFWKVCEALDCELRIRLLRYLLEAEESEFPCVNELAGKFKVSSAAMSVHLKKLAMVGLIVSKRMDRRVYYRAFATTPGSKRVLMALRDFFTMRPKAARMRDLLVCIHALSHARRNAIVRCLHIKPGICLKDLAIDVEMPLHTADRLWGELARAHIIDLRGAVVLPTYEPESTLMHQTLA